MEADGGAPVRDAEEEEEEEAVGGGGGQPCDLECHKYANKSKEDLKKMSAAASASNKLNAETVGVALSPYFQGAGALRRPGRWAAVQAGRTPVMRRCS